MLVFKHLCLGPNDHKFSHLFILWTQHNMALCKPATYPLQLVAQGVHCRTNSSNQCTTGSLHHSWECWPTRYSIPETMQWTTAECTHSVSNYSAQIDPQNVPPLYPHSDPKTNLKTQKCTWTCISTHMLKCTNDPVSTPTSDKCQLLHQYALMNR